MYVYITESLCCTPETNTMLYVNQLCFNSNNSSHLPLDSDLLPWAGNTFTVCFCLWCIKKAAGLALKSFFPILWSVHSWICSHVADNRWIASPALLSSSASGGSYSTCCALSLLSLDSAPSAAQLFQALE